MALEVVYGPSLEALAVALSERKQRGRSLASPIAPVPVIAERRAVASWLKTELALRDGIAANLEISSVSGFFRTLAESSTVPLLILDHESWLAAVLSVLRDEDRLGGPLLSSVRAYVFAAGRGSELVEVRRHQLAREVGRLFDLYSWWRPDLVERLGDARQDSAGGSDLGWLGALYRAAVERAEAAAKAAGQRLLPLPSLSLELPGLVRPEELHVFAPTRLPPAALALFERLAKTAAVNIYAVNPTHIFWENRAEPVALPLERWAGERRELVRSLNALSGYGTTDLPSEEPPPTSLLERARAKLREGGPEPVLEVEPGREAAPLDVSLTTLSLPSLRREIEAVAQEIWRMVEESARLDAPEDRLRFPEIAVMIASDVPEVLLHVEAVFKETHQLPHAIIEGPVEGDSAIFAAAELLLSLPLGMLRRREVLRFLTHPLVLLPYSDIEPSEWARWCEDTAILWGADRVDHSATYVDRDMYSWDQGLRRLALGLFMEEGTAQERGEDRYAAEPVPLSRADSAGRFLLLARSLLADLRFVRSGQRTGAEWAEILSRLISTYLYPATDADSRVLRRILRATAELKSALALAGKLPYRAVYELLKDRIQGLTTSAPLSEGVVVGPLPSLGELPFRVVFVVGLGADRFLEGKSESPLDLRGSLSKPSDLFPDDRHRQAYFSAIFAAKERVVLSWVGRDALTGEPIEPAPVVGELLRWLKETNLGAPHHVEVRPERWEPVVQAEPEPTPAEPSIVLLGAREEQRAQALLQRFFESAGRAPTFDEIEDATREWSAEARAGVERALGLPEIVGRIEPSQEKRVRLSDLRDFLLDPIQGAARFLLGRTGRDAEAELFFRDEERLSSEPYDRTQHLLGALLLAIAEAEPVERVPFLVDRHYQAEAERRAQVNARPIGIFAEVERAADGEILRKIWAQVAPQVRRRGALRPVIFGRPDGSLGEVMEALRLEVEGGAEVEVVGRTEPIVDEPSAIVRVSLRSGRELKRRNSDVLRLLLDHIALAAAGREARQGRRALLLFAGKTGQISAEQVTLKPLDQRTAKGWLSALVSDLMAGPPDHFLPIELAMKLSRAGGDPELVSRSVRENLLRLGRSGERPPELVPDTHLVPAPSRGEVDRLVARRYRLLDQLWEGEPW